LASLSSPAPAQKRDQVDDVRDAFLVTRKRVSADKSGPPAGGGRPTAAKAARAVLIGLGYSLYQRDPNGNPVRVAPSREFHQGDAVRLLIESNVSGYLYIFYTENDGPAQMIFPDARLNEGDNRIRAHVPYEAPSSKETDPRHRWFSFDNQPATERLYLVVAKTPLPEAPIGKQLMAHCRADANACPWRPAANTWNTLVAAAAAPAREDKSGELGQLLTAVETRAVERGFGLGLDAPAPTVIRMSQSPQAKQLATMIVLIHK
jgi:hypothetical protein